MLYPLQRVKTLPPKKGVSWAWHKTAYDGEAPVLKIWIVWGHAFIAITPSFILTQSGSTC